MFEAFFDAWARRGRHSIAPEDLPEARAVFTEILEPLLAELPAADAAVERARLLGSATTEGFAESVFRLEAEQGEPVVGRLLEHELNGEFDIEGEEGTRRVSLRGTADRIDLLGDSTFRILDYKLGRAPNTSRALQLPIYAVCAGQQFSQQGSPRTLAEAGYIPFAGLKRFVPLARPSEREAAVRDAQARLVKAIDEMALGEFPPRPAEPFLCTWCPYSGVCRKDYVGDV